MRPDEQRVTIYYPGEDLASRTPIRLCSGHRRTRAAAQPLVTEIATPEAALDWLRVATFARGGNAVLLLDRKQSDSQAVYVTTGIAMRCILTEDAADSSVGPPGSPPQSFKSKTTSVDMPDRRGLASPAMRLTGLCSALSAIARLAASLVVVGPDGGPGGCQTVAHLELSDDRQWPRFPGLRQQSQQADPLSGTPLSLPAPQPRRPAWRRHRTTAACL